MVRFRATLVRPLADQSDRDDWRIDPAGVTFDPETDYPIFRDFDYAARVGHGRISTEDDGSLVVEGELDLPIAEKFLAIGVYVDESTKTPDSVFVGKSRVMSVSTTDSHSDPRQPPIVIEED